MSSAWDFELPELHARPTSVEESEALYRAALTSLGEGVIIQHSDSTIVAANEAAPRILGLTMDQMLGRTSLDPNWKVIHRDGSAFPGETHPVPIALREKRAVRDVVMGVRKPDSTISWIMVNVEPIRDVHGLDTGSVVCSYTDITAQIDADDRYRMLAENSTDVVILLGPDHRVQWVSPSVEATLGWSPLALVGRAMVELIHPDDQAGVLTVQQDALGSGADRARAECRVATSEGGWRWMAVSGRLLRDDAGEVIGDLSAMRDIEVEMKGRSAVAAARAELEETYHLLAENVTGVVFRADHHGCFTWISDSVEQMIGFTRDEILGRPFLDMVHPEDQSVVRRTQAGIARREPGDMRLRVRAKDGTYRWVDARVRPILDPSSAGVARMGSWTDAEAEVEAREAQAGSEALLRTALRSAAIGMALADLHGAFTLVNPAFATMLGRSEEWLLQHRVDDVIHPQHGALVDSIRESLDHGETEKFEGQLRLLRADGELMWARVAAVLVGDPAGHERAFMIQAVDVTAERAAQEQLSYAAFHDSLTGLRNRAWLLDMLEVDLRTAGRGDTDIGVFFIDLDNFKLINDSLGHAAGDEVLKSVADRIVAVLRPGDRVGRFGGDEFVVVVPHVQSGTEVEQVAERISAAISCELIVQGHRIVPTASMGIAVSSASSTPSSLLRDTDSALFRAKDAGRARWHFFDEAMHAQAVERLTLEDELRGALARHEFVLHYQPIVRLRDCEVVGHEALIRWQHPDRGLLSPCDFLEVAEDSGLIVGIGRQALDQVCALLASDRNLPGPVNVNFSGVELSARDWHAQFVETVLRHGVDPRRLIVEVTETAVLSLVDTTHSDLEALLALGVGVEVDDFGTGFSSISLLRDLPVTGLKLDRSFVRDLTDGESPANALAAGVAGLAQGLHLVGVAEGIETAAQHRTLFEQGWTHGQGYLFGRPEAVPRTEALVHRVM
jgi:diguanylate cyclase (GGDEF)-like protein/PAS domain S-box-containing protein